MKKISLLILTLALIAAMFTGCRRTMPETTGTTTVPKTTAAAPATTAKRPEPIVTLPSPTDLLPEGTTGPARGDDMGRGRMGPRF